MLDGNKSVSSEVLLYWVDNYLLNENVGSLEKRLFDWWLSEGFFCVSNFKKTDTGTSAELMLLLGGSIYDVTGEIEVHRDDVLNNSVKEKLKSGWELILKIKPNYYIVEDTENNRKKIKSLLSNNIRHFEIVDFVTKQDESKTIIKSVIINIFKRR